MALGPRLDLRQSQSLVMTPQLQQAIKLLALSNLEIESFIAEEMEKNPLLETARRGRAGDRAPEPEPEPADAAATPTRSPRPTRPAARARSTSTSTSENFHQDSAGRSMRGLDGGLGLSGEGMSGGGSGEGPDFDAFAGDEVSLHDHLRRQAGEMLSGADLVIAEQIIDRIDETGYFLAPLARARPAPRRAARRGRARARHRPDLRSRRHRRAQPRRMPRAAGEGRRPLRPGDGAADRQSRLSRQGQSRRAEADLRGRRRGHGRHDPRASRLRSQARLPLHGLGAGRRDRPRHLRRPPRRRLGGRAEQRDPAAAARQPHLLSGAVERPAGQASPAPGSTNACRAPTG